MNEIKKCSIANIAFTMELDAYEALEAYLESLEQTYSDTADGAEIIADLEARIAELILSAQNNDQVVEKPLIENIIRQLGTAEDLSGNDKNATAHPYTTAESQRFPRRLYRDLENARLGGVCAGLGRYFHLDPTWLRLGIFLPVVLGILFSYAPFGGWISRFLSNIFEVFILGYLVMWFAVPAARSARQKLEMQGKPVTTRSVVNATTSQNDPDGHAKLTVAKTVSALSTVILILLKLLAGFLVFALIFAACVGIFCAILLLSQAIGESPVIFWLIIVATACALIPVFLFVYVLISLIASLKPSGKWILGIFALWITSVLLFMGLGIRVCQQEGLTPERIAKLLIHEDDYFDRPKSNIPPISLKQQLDELEQTTEQREIGVPEKGETPAQEAPSATPQQ